MASISVLTLKEAIIPLVPSFNVEELRTVKIKHKWKDNGNVDKEAEMHLPICSDPSEKEVFLYVVNQFNNAVHEDRLHLSTAKERYSKFCYVLEGDVLLAWQQFTANAGNAATLADFEADVRRLIGTYLHPTSREDQLEYLRTTTKPFSMSCAALGSRIRVISQLGRYLPGSYDEGANVSFPLFATDDMLKRAYFLLMPSSWRIKFAESGQVLEGAYTYQNLIRFMSIQEMVSKRSSNSSHPSGHGGKRRANHHHGGRGGGRGRGRGRTNQGNYRPRYYGYSSYQNAYNSYSSPGRGSAPSSPATPVAPQQFTRHYNTRSNSGRAAFSPTRYGRDNGGRGSGRGYPPLLPRGMAPRNPNPPLIPMNDSRDSHYAEQYMMDPTHADQAHHHSSVYDHNDAYHAEQEQPNQEHEDAHWLDQFGL